MIGEESYDSHRWRAIVRHVLARFGLSVTDVQFLNSAGGLSGAQIFKIHGAERTWCLRNWQTQKSATRLAIIHRRLRLAVAGGCSFVPLPRATLQGPTWVDWRDNLWELTPWLPGRADFSTNPTEARLQAMVDAVVQLHRVWQTDGEARSTSVYDRDRLGQQVRSACAQLAAHSPSAGGPIDAQLAARLQVIRHLAAQVAGRIARRADETRELHVPVQPIHGDLWHDHVLLQNDRVAGIVDFGASRVGPRIADVARLLGSLCGSNRSVWLHAAERYRQQVGLSTAEFRLLELLDQSAPLLSAANWARWIEVEQIQFASRGTVLARLDAVIARLEYLAQ